MQLVYSLPDNTTIQATLDVGDRLGNFTGSVTIYVPADPANAEYSDVLAQGYTIEPYVGPPPLIE